MQLNYEEIAVLIIANAGDCKSNSYGAIEAAKEGEFEEAHELLKLSEVALHKAHKAHTELIKEDSNGGFQLSFLLVHASNLLSIAEVSKEFAEEIVCLYERMKGGE